MKKTTNEEFIQKLKKVNQNIIPLEEYQKSSIKIKFKCLIDNNEFLSSPCNILAGHGCPICSGKKRVISCRLTKLKANNCYLGVKRPVLSQCLKDKNDAMNYGYMSHEKLDWICPTCNYEFSKEPGKFLEDRLVCPNCIKNDSYPNRFIFSLLKQLNINFEREFSPKWISSRRYDFYFVKNNKKYIVEMDGGFHRYEDIIENDKEKDYIAQNHNITVIRIDCDYNKITQRKDFIIKNIKNSKFYELFDIDDKMFEIADSFGIENEIKYICRLWEQYNDVYKIQEECKLSLLTIRRYLRFANENQICNYNQKEDHKAVRERNTNNSNFARSIPVKCDQTGEVFPNMKYAGIKYKCNVSSYFYQNRTHAGQLNDGTKLTWSKISKDEFRKIKNMN